MLKIHVYVYMYLKFRIRERRERETWSFHPLVHSLHGHKAQGYVRPMPGASSGSPTWVAGGPTLELSFAAFPVFYQGAGLGAEKSGTNQHLFAMVVSQVAVLCHSAAS